jgi:hypothetical protein
VYNGFTPIFLRYFSKSHIKEKNKILCAELLRLRGSSPGFIAGGLEFNRGRFFEIPGFGTVKIQY